MLPAAALLSLLVFMSVRAHACVCACTPCGRVRHVVEAACAGLDGPHSLEARLAGRDFLLHAP